eukprot:a4018_38.p1 GENE.a4018_38~~a4018_38.p1  ORF type:complete len:216 (+),score=59.90 a4018_38:35-649(+)
MAAVLRRAEGELLLAEGERPLLTLSDVAFVAEGVVETERAGTLYVTSLQMLWIDNADPTMSYALDYPSIVMHAVSTSSAHFARPCLYVQAGAPEDDPLTIRFVMPSSDAATARALEDLFAAVSQAMCESMVSLVDSNEFGEEGGFFTEESDLTAFLASDPDARARYARLEAAFTGVDYEGEGEGEGFEGEGLDDDGASEAMDLE